jgi:hypothetical protein
VRAIKKSSGIIEMLLEISSTIASAVEGQGAKHEISRNVQQVSNITDVLRGARESGSASQLLSASRSCASRRSALATISSRISRPMRPSRSLHMAILKPARIPRDFLSTPTRLQINANLEPREDIAHENELTATTVSWRITNVPACPFPCPHQDPRRHRDDGRRSLYH